MPLCVSIANIYTYKLVKPNGESAENYVYPNTPGLYSYKIQLSGPANYSGFNKGRFDVTLEYGQFSDGTSKMTNVPENTTFSVTWTNIANPGNNVHGIVRISAATAVDAPADMLKAGDPIQFSPLIASLKGQMPSFAVLGANPPMGTKQQLTAKVFEDMIYPGIFEKNIYGVYENKKVKNYQWTLPPNWKTVPQGKTGTFITDPDVKEIVVETDYFTPGTINVRAVNDIGTAYSETASQNFDRGFSFTNYPSSPISFGQTSTYTFAVTPVSGITFEWEVPSGWQINGQGNVLEGVNLNSVNVTTSSFCSNSSVVRVRLKKDAEVSGWFTCIYPGVSQPVISIATSPIYQFEDVSLLISNIPPSIISSVNWSGDGVVTTSSQGAGAKLVFTKSGKITLTAAVLLNGCSTPIPYTQDVIVGSHRLSISGPSQICEQGTYTIDHLSAGVTLVWSATPSGVVSLHPNGNSVTLTKVSGGSVALSATINNSVIVTKSSIQVGTVVPPFYLYRGLYGVSSGVVGKNYTFKAYGANASTNDLDYYWTVTTPDVEDEFPLEFGGREFDFMASTPGNYTVTLSCNGGCGWSDPVTKIFYFQESMGFALSPNPASSNTTISMISSANANTATLLSASASLSVSTSYSVSVLDAYGSVVYTGKKNGKQFTIPTASLRNGAYSIIVSDGTNTYQNKLIVKH